MIHSHTRGGGCRVCVKSVLRGDQSRGCQTRVCGLFLVSPIEGGIVIARDPLVFFGISGHDLIPQIAQEARKRETESIGPEVAGDLLHFNPFILFGGVLKLLELGFHLLQCLGNSPGFVGPLILGLGGRLEIMVHLLPER